MKLVAFESVDSGRKFLACAEKVNPTFVVTNHLLDVIQTLSPCYVIRLQRIYNFLLFHAIIVSILDVLYAIICHYISFFGTNLLTQCLVPVAIFCLFLPFQKIIIKKCPNEKKIWINFFWTNREAEEKTFPPPQASVLLRSLLEAFSGTLPEGESITEGFYINLAALPMMC